jgi:hypothetical protein
MSLAPILQLPNVRNVPSPAGDTSPPGKNFLTDRIDKDHKADLREIAFNLWMACYSDEEIAEHVGYSRRLISEFLETIRSGENGTGAVYADLSEMDGLL